MAATANTSANSVQIGGAHYKQMPLEHWDLVALAGLDYYQGNITKYVMRWRDKGGLEDLKKARHYLDKYIELETLRAQHGDSGMRAQLLHATHAKELRDENEAGEETGTCDDEPSPEQLLREPRCQSRAPFAGGLQCVLAQGHACMHKSDDPAPLYWVV